MREKFVDVAGLYTGARIKEAVLRFGRAGAVTGGGRVWGQHVRGECDGAHHDSSCARLGVIMQRNRYATSAMLAVNILAVS
jgi:hypothetical protein